jgi:glycosyltransferase involved in cell wall biosynthesis
MKIVMITGHQYPVGTALTNRIRSYLEVLASLGHDVSVIIYRPSEDGNNVQNDSEGTLNGVRYRSTAHSLIKSKNPIIARVTWVYGYVNCMFTLFAENRVGHIDTIIQGSSKSSLIPLVYLFTRITRSKFVLENNEYPWFILKKGKISNGFYKLLYLGLYYKLFDGVLAMTTSLQRYHNKHSKKSAQILLVPMTVDVSRFHLTVPRENYIAYVGNRSYKKDGVDILLAAFTRITKHHPDWKLMIIGDTGCDTSIKEQLDNANLSDSVILTGSVHRDVVPELLCRSKILVLSRPNSLQSEGGFPTKLGEYLATGNLLITTSVGDIPSYLTDGVSALLATPDSVESFAEKMTFAIDRYKELETVRINGYNVCLNVFNAQVQGQRISRFLTNLVDGGRSFA